MVHDFITTWLASLSPEPGTLFSFHVSLSLDPLAGPPVRLSRPLLLCAPTDAPLFFSSLKPIREMEGAMGNYYHGFAREHIVVSKRSMNRRRVLTRHTLSTRGIHKLSTSGIVLVSTAVQQ